MYIDTKRNEMHWTISSWRIFLFASLNFLIFFIALKKILYRVHVLLAMSSFQRSDLGKLIGVKDFYTINDKTCILHSLGVMINLRHFLFILRFHTGNFSIYYCFWCWFFLNLQNIEIKLKGIQQIYINMEHWVVE